ncbi:MAG: glycosyltransferase family 4 protein [Methanobacteriota archaeon]|nr:MAG: glycosyltransferase family 4 protein [Euryarchaeota archaeon]
MKVEIITSSADPDHGGFGARVHGLVSMFASFADVRVLMTDWFNGPRVAGVEYASMPIPDTLRTRLGRLKTYYRRDFPKRDGVDPPDLVVAESLDLLGLHQYGPRVPLILDEHNVYWNLLPYDIVNAPFFRGWVGRRSAVRRRLVPKLLARAKRFEVQAIRRSARTLVTSDEDRAAILAECPEAAPRVRVLPNCVDLQRIPPLPDPAESKDVVFVGGFGYVPNQEAAEFVRRSLAPSLPHVRFLLVGPDPPSGAMGPNVVATGRVPDLRDVLKDAAVCIAPLFHGSGTRVKILTYMAASKAVVATTKACEGLPVRDGRDLLIRDSPEGFRDAVQGLLDDRRKRRDLGDAGRALVESMFDWRVHVGRLRELSDEVIAEVAR